MIFQKYRIRRVCRRAAKLLRSRDWTQGVYYDEQGFCIVGALQRIIRNDELERAAIRRVLDQIPATELETYGRSPEGRLFSWNDDPRRTKTHVLNALTQAAQR